MERTERRIGTRGSAWFSTVLGALLLMVLGFGLGLIVGAAFEEPDLVLGHVAGETEEVDLDAMGEAPLGPELEAAPPPLGTRPTDSKEQIASVETRPKPPIGAVPSAPERRAPAPARSAPAPAPVSAPAVSSAPPAGGFSVQVGAFSDPATADRLRGTLDDAGLPVYVQKGDAAGAPRWRVRVGPVSTRSEAERMAKRLEREQKLPTWILSGSDR